ncbi:septum formation initiator family protein [Bdellovibrionota bacterium FG-1]
MNKTLTPGKLWACLFGLWGIFLSGVGATFVGSPGVIQSIRLQSLLKSKQAQVELVRQEIKRLQSEASLLEKSKVIQQREIRRVLGYAAPDEIIFDFSTAETLTSF